MKTQDADEGATYQATTGATAKTINKRAGRPGERDKENKTGGR